MTGTRRLAARAAVATAVLVGTFVATTTASSANAKAPAPQAAWQSAIAQLPAPSGTGCYSADYPTLAWHAVRCTVAPQVAFAPAHAMIPATAARAKAAVVGNGHDYAAVVPGLISKATGSFAHVSPGITEKGSGAAGTGPNTYSLQLNTEFFTTPACAGSSTPANCQGWQQFIYDSQADSIFIQYWLLNYTSACPAGWTSYAGDCYVNSSAATFAGSTVTAAQLATTSFSGTATLGGNDTVELTNGTQATVVHARDSQLTLAQSWHTTEFGLFGDGGGSQAKFAKRASLEAITTLVASTATAPSCVSEGFTGETNNLKLAASTILGTVASPTIGSTQTLANPRTASCATAS